MEEAGRGERETDNDDSFTVHDEDDPVFVPGITVNLDPVDGKNIAGDFETYTSAEEDDDDTEDIDETHQFDFGEIAAGVYAPSVSDGWRVRLGGKATEAMVGNALNPLEGAVQLDVTPATGIVYGYVRDVEEFPVAEVTVTVNGVAAETDVHGRYIAEGISPQTRTISRVTHRNSFFVETDHEGSGTTRKIIAFVANSPVNWDIELSGKGNQALISGTVTASGSGAPVAGAEILVDGEAPNNKATRGVNTGKLVTDADGFYTAGNRRQGHRRECHGNRGAGRHELRACGAGCSGPRRCGYQGHRLHRLRARQDYGQGEESGRQRHGWRFGHGHERGRRRSRGRCLKHHQCEGYLRAQRAVRRL